MKVRLPKGMGGPRDMNSMLKQAQQMQEEMERLETELDSREYTVSAGGGAVTVSILGSLNILSIEIKPEIVDPDDIATLEDVITAGINEAIKTVVNAKAEEMKKITGGINLPGAF